MKNKQQIDIKEEIDSLSKDWDVFVELKNLDEIDRFLNVSKIGEIINFTEIENIFADNKINFTFKKVKAYLQDFFINNTYTQIQKKLFAIDQQKFENGENSKLFEDSLFIKKIIKLYLFDELQAFKEVEYKTKNSNMSVDVYIDKMMKEFMLECFIFMKTFVK